MTSIWTKELDAELLRLRDKEGLSFPKTAKALGVRRDQALGRYHRLKKTKFQSLADRHLRRKRIYQPCRHEKLIEASKYPFAADSSCPDFAWDELHCAAVLAAGGFAAFKFRTAA